MQISLENLGRRFNREWIFRGLNYDFLNNDSYAILGANGAGKSTLLQLIAGSLGASEGSVKYSLSGLKVEDEKFFGYLGLVAPYLELVEEFTLSEHIDFHFKFKSFRESFDRKSVIELLGFHRAESKAVKHFSSGMKQRLKLVLALCADTPVVMLDEPTVNLDRQGIDWFLSLMENYGKERLLIVSSNQEHEYHFCNNQIQIEDYKSVSMIST